MIIERGTRVASYEIITLLGSGGMGEVYGARDTRLDRQVALKFISQSLAAHPAVLARFEREARAASALNHPHILHIYDIGMAELEPLGPRHYIAMEYVDGATLSRKIHSEQSTVTSMLAWLSQVADALSKAHEAGIVHRDLKPDNVMISRDGYAKVLDFGLAKLAQPFNSSSATDARSGSSSSIVLGTVGYMAPEQAAGGEVDHRADLFSFGCMLYEALTRQRAFEGDSAVDTLHRIIYSQPAPPPPDVRIHPDLQRIIDACLAKRPAERPASARALGEEIRALAGQMNGVVSHSDTRPRSGASHIRLVPVVAVLPFDDLSAEDDYFGEGLTDEIISDLSKIESIRVVSRSSVMRFRRERKDVRVISRELGANYVVDGSVRRAGSQLRVTAGLVDALRDETIWAETYKGTLDDVFDIQERVARAIAQALKVKLSPEESARLAERPIQNVHAYEAYLRARKSVGATTAEELDRAFEELEAAEQLIGENELLLAARGYLYWQRYNSGLGSDEQTLDETVRCADRIFVLDPESHHGHRLLALVLLQRMQIQEAVRHFKRALRVEPNDADSLVWLVIMYAVVGHPEAAEPLMERALAVDPLSWISLLAPATVRLYEGSFAQALNAAEKAWKLNTVGAAGTFFFAMILVVQGQWERAREIVDEAYAYDPENVFIRLARALCLAVRGDEQALAYLDERLLAALRGDAQYCTWIGEIHALLGRRDEALQWIGRGIERGFVPWRYFAEFNPLVSTLRGDPAFDALVAKARLASEAFEV